MSGVEAQSPIQPFSLASCLSIDGQIRRWAQAEPDKEFLSWFEGEPSELLLSRLTWREFALALDATVAFLIRHGIERGQTVCLHGENSPEAALLLAACSTLRCRFVPTNWRLTPTELGYILRDSDARLVIAGERQLDVANATAGVLVLPQADLRSHWQEWLATRDTVNAAGVSTADLSDRVILYTSGTTSSPKGVRISETALLHAGYHISGFTGVSNADRSLAVLPMCHVNGLCYNLMVAVAIGASVCVVNRFSSSSYWRQAACAGATISWMAATPMRMILARPESPADREHPMRMVIYGQNLTDEGFTTWRRRFGTDLMQIYGSTETVTLPINNHTTAVTRPDTTIGVPSPGVLARLSADADTAPDGSRIGELELKLTPGHHMMTGYLNQDAATAARFSSDGWFMTGDTMELRPDGLLYFVDRNGDIIKVKGENVSASEVEHALEKRPEIAEAAVVGVPDEMTDHAIRAYVVARDTALDVERLRCALTEVLADFKIPAQFVCVDSLPRTNTGKVQKALLVEGARETHPWR